MGHVWTAPWQGHSDVRAALVGCGHVSGLLMRQVWPDVDWKALDISFSAGRSKSQSSIDVDQAGSDLQRSREPNLGDAKTMRSISTLLLTAVLVTACGPTPGPHPPPPGFLWWKMVESKAFRYSTCMDYVRRGAGAWLSGNRVTASEVTGYSVDGSVYVAVTCVERGGQAIHPPLRAMAIVMGVSASNSKFAKGLIEDIANEVRTTGEVEYDF